MVEVSDPDWVHQEMESLRLPDERLKKRTIKIIADFSQNPTGSIPEFCGEWAATQATYHYCDHQAVSPEALVAAHCQATLGRIAAGGYQTVLAIQDTTEYNFTAHLATEGLGPLDNRKSKGFFVHSTLAVSPAGLPLGLLAQEVWVRTETDQAQDRYRPIELRESFKWFTGLTQSSGKLPSSVQVIQVSDQESDIFEYFVYPRPDNVALLVRSYQSREVVDEIQPIRSTLRTSPVRGKVEVEVSRTPQREPRTAVCQVYFKRVKIRPPKLRPGLPPDLQPVALSAVLIQEMNPPEGAEALEWLLLTTLALTTFDHACQIIQYYTYRWLIERLHFVLKSGCALEDRQLRTLDRLQRFLALAQVVAWRLLWLTYLGRAQPDLPCTVAFTDEEWKALYAYTHKTAIIPNQPPTLQQMTLWLAKLGGFLERKSDGNPGLKVLWRGWPCLFHIVQTWLIFNSS
jgi:hypothetical protein